MSRIVKTLYENRISSGGTLTVERQNTWIFIHTNNDSGLHLNFEEAQDMVRSILAEIADMEAESEG